MIRLHRSRGVARLGLAALAVCLQLATPFAASTSAQSANAAASSSPNVGTCPDAGPADYPVAGGWFYTQEARGCITNAGPDRRRGYLVQDDDETGAFWTEFRRYGGVKVLGYPVSQPYHYPVDRPDGYWYQAFEKGILQWQPENRRAVLANVFDQFTEQNLDDDLAVLGIPGPKDDTPTDDNTRMSWLTEPLFMARYFFDPVAPHSSDPDRPGLTAFTNVDQAEMFFGVPQSMPDRLPLLGRAVNGKRQSLYPLTHSFMAQRFQKGGMELFFDKGPEKFAAPVLVGASVQLDPTVVPGDVLPGCPVLTAVGLLARTLGADKLIPSSATDALPLDPAHPWVDAIVPNTVKGQITTPFELAGSGFKPYELVTVTLTQVVKDDKQKPYTKSFQANTYANGSFDLTVSDFPVDTYVVTAAGGAPNDQFESPVPLDLTVPTIPQQSVTGTACPQVGLPVDN